MRVTDIITKKGGDIVSLPSTATVAELVEVLATRRIGAVLIVDDGDLQGIASERDVVRYLNQSGDQASAVTTIMTAEVTTCGLGDEVRDLAAVMTNKRIRHLPVVADGRLVAIVSIGDIVKARLDELEAERDHLHSYLNS